MVVKLKYFSMTKNDKNYFKYKKKLIYTLNYKITATEVSLCD